MGNICRVGAMQHNVCSIISLSIYLTWHELVISVSLDKMQHWKRELLHIVSLLFFPCKRKHSTLSTILNTAECKTICAVSSPVPSQILMLRGLANLLATMHLSSIAEWLTTLTTVKETNKQNKEEEARLVSLPPPSAGIFSLISSFSITKGFFFLLLPTHWDFMCPSSNSNPPLSCSLSLSLAASVASSLFLCISPFKYSFCENASVRFLWLYPLKGEVLQIIHVSL